MMKCGFKQSASRRESVLVSDLPALGAGYRKDHISPVLRRGVWALPGCSADTHLGTAAQPVQV